VGGAMERSADNGITLVQPPRLRRRGLLCPGMKVETITIAGGARALSVTDIALDLGFRDTSSFSTTFRKLVEQTPTDYRRSLPPGKA
jgi:AraC-like DNA-binding protein